MSRLSVRLALLLAIALGLMLSGCGNQNGNGDGGEGSGDDGGGDDADDGDDGDRVDGGVGPGEPAEGQFRIIEGTWGEGGFQHSRVSGSIVDPRPRYHRLEQESGACRLWRYEVAGCSDCEGLCNADGKCVPLPEQLSAGNVTIEGLGEPLVMRFDDYGYYVNTTVPNELFDQEDRVRLQAAGGGDVAKFALSADGVEPITIDLEPGEGAKVPDMIRMENGADFVLRWSPIVRGTRVRLEIVTDNRGHGLPVDAMIECDADDTGELVVPRAMVEAFPDRQYYNACAGTDCPPSTLTRYLSDRTEVDGRAMELVVGAQQEFIVVHDAR